MRANCRYGEGITFQNALTGRRGYYQSPQERSESFERFDADSHDVARDYPSWDVDAADVMRANGRETGSGN